MLIKAGNYTDNDKASVPWGEIAHCWTDWLAVDHWPRGVNFKDPSKLQLTEAQTVFQHWTERQSNKMVVVKFKKAGTGHMKFKGKRKLNITMGGVNDNGEDHDSDIHSDTALPTPGPSQSKGKKKAKKQYFGTTPSSVLDNSQRRNFLDRLSTDTHYVELLECLRTLPVSHMLSWIFIYK
jgi:hypothetical protein